MCFSKGRFFLFQPYLQCYKRAPFALCRHRPRESIKSKNAHPLPFQHSPALQILMRPPHHGPQHCKGYDQRSARPMLKPAMMQTPTIAIKAKTRLSLRKRPSNPKEPPLMLWPPIAPKPLPPSSASAGCC